MELVSKNYMIHGTSVAIQLKFYDNGRGSAGVVATHIPSGKIVSTKTGVNMDDEIVRHFETMLRKRKKWYIVHMPDGEVMCCSHF